MPPGGPPGYGMPPGGPPGYGGPPSFGAPPGGGPPFGGAPRTAPDGSPLEQDRGVIILVLSLLSLFVMVIGCTLFCPLSLGSLGLSIPAILMARRDLAAIQAGRMNPGGRDAVQIGLVLAIVSTVTSAVIALVMLLVGLLYGGLIGAALLSQPH